MLSLHRVYLPTLVPVVGCTVVPYIIVRRADSSISSIDVFESASIDGCCIDYTWYRIQIDTVVPVCSIHPTEQATIQCDVCFKANVPSAKSYHCSSMCLKDAWQHHLYLHEQASNMNSSSAPSIPVRSGETWFVVGRSRTYIPNADDIGHSLKFECVPVHVETGIPVGSSSTVMTSPVLPAPSPLPRRRIRFNSANVHWHLYRDGPNDAFTVLSYNILSDHNAASATYSYCPSWALSWPYRSQNLLKEIIAYHADIICLQEVQSNHFEDFFSPELDKHGYQALYKKKTTEVYKGNLNALVGCATFFRKDRFSVYKKYDVEFNKTIHSFADQIIQPNERNNALSHCIMDNIALIVVLEVKFCNRGVDNQGNTKHLCVTNTHMGVRQAHEDVKLWQVYILLKGLERIAISSKIPMLLCGDFNSAPGSASHSLLVTGKVDQLYPIADPLGILQPPSKLIHQIPLASAYSTFARMVREGHGLESQRRSMNLKTNEPLFTTFSRDCIETADFIFYTVDSLTVESLLELLDEVSLRIDTALPSPKWSSDHIALLAEFRVK